MLLRTGSLIPTPRGAHTQRAPVDPPQLWCVDQERGIAPGSDVFLLHTGQAPGLVARGLVSRAPFLAARADRVGTVGQHITVEWLEVLSVAGRIPLDILHVAVPDWSWQGAGPAVVLPADILERVERVWMHWHHKPQRRHHVDWDRDLPSEGFSVQAAHPSGVSRHRHAVQVGHHLRADARRAG